MKGKRDPVGRLARLIFGERKDPNGPDANRLIHQIQVGYAKTGSRARAKTARDAERAALIEAVGKDRLMTESLGKAFLNECIAALDKTKGCTPPRGGWSHNSVRLLIRNLRKPPAGPPPFVRDPADYEFDDDSDM